MNLRAKNQIEEILAARKAKVKFKDHGGKWIRDQSGRRFYRAHFEMALAVEKGLKREGLW